MIATFADVATLSVGFRAENSFAGEFEAAIWLAEIVADPPFRETSGRPTDQYVTLRIDKGIAAVCRNPPGKSRYRLLSGRRKTSRGLPARKGTLGLKYIEDSRSSG